MFYLSDGHIYIEENGKYRNVGFTAKDKVITRVELESTEMVMGDVVVELIDNSIPLTRDEIILKFGLSEKNPIKVITKKKKSE